MMADDFGGGVEELSLDRRAFKEGRNLVETVIYQMEKWEGLFFVVKHREYQKEWIVTLVDICSLDLNRGTSGEVEVQTVVYREPTWFERLFKKGERHSYIDREVIEVERIETTVLCDHELIIKIRDAYERWTKDEALIRETTANRNAAQKRLDGARAINRLI
jgi:hypothetical protein